MDFGLCVFVDKMFIFRVSPAIFLTKKACGAMLTLIKGKFRFSLGCKVLAQRKELKSPKNIKRRNIFFIILYPKENEILKNYNNIKFIN
ncbi:hypothetical protein B10460_16470 [Campylobacter coli]|nr:hypothetical protein B10307_17950 [Campylobacter coli]BEJ83077.1 hypothetical protein B10460_16470 [Campylobacter coli]BEK09590.1 hypothetical protein B10879_15700 [Campylobacter coli]BEK19933.1 hypothetical protein B11051_15880 [Campylobacter coli]BEK48647.1 hypothetical protein B11568_15740 [Campylobacter coli]